MKSHPRAAWLPPAWAQGSVEWLSPRGSPAILVVLSISFPLLAPLLSPNPEQRLPACCRRDGVHRCAMLEAVEARLQDSGLVVKSAHTRCPLYPTGKAAPTGKASAPLPVYVAIAAVWSRPAAVEQTEARFRLSFSRTCQKRGPPSLLS